MSPTPPCPVKFDAERHLYFLSGKMLSSVSYILKRCTPPFDPDGSILRRCAERERISEAELKQRWEAKRDASLARGRAIHAALQAFVENSFVFDGHLQHVDQLKRWPFRGKLFCETILWSEPLGIAGTADLIELTSDKTLKIFDFKTNEKMETDNRWNRFLLPPVAHLAQTEYQKYELQLSFYALMLEGFGWQIERLTLFHIDHEGRWTSHKTRFLKAECLEILKHR